MAHTTFRFYLPVDRHKQLTENFSGNFQYESDIKKTCAICNTCGKLIGDNNYSVHIIRHAFDDDMAKHKTVTLDKKIEDPLRLV